MAQWYFCVQERRYGPVEEETLRQWVREGRILPDNFVWTDEMRDWQRLEDLPQFSSLLPATPKPVTKSLGRRMELEWVSPCRQELFPRLPSSPGGHAGKTGMGKIFRDARCLLPTCVPAILVYVVLTSCFSLFSSHVTTSIARNLQEQPEQFSRSHQEIMQWMGYLVPLGVTTLNMVLLFGMSLVCLTAVRRQRPRLRQLFRGFRLFRKVIGTSFLIAIMVFLWGLLLIVPGIIAAMRFTLSYFVLLDHPEVGIRKAMSRSEQLMQGQKMRLFLALLLLYSPGIGMQMYQRWYLTEYQVTTIPIWLQITTFVVAGFTVSVLTLLKARFYQSALPSGAPLPLPKGELR
jgi:uncharacterized membrane protein